MFEDSPDVPPAVMLLLMEVVAKGRDIDDARRRLKALLPDLRAQSEVYEAANKFRPREHAPPGRLDIYLDGGLNLFHEKVGCRAWNCRTNAAIQLTRSIGLIADIIWLTDYLTERFCRFGRITNQKLDEVLADALVLSELMPLILAGIIKFRSPWIPACRNCLSHFDNEVDKIADFLLEEYSAEFSLKSLGADVYSLGTGSLYQPSMDLRIMPSKRGVAGPPSTDKFSRQIVHTAVRSALWVGREAVIGGGAIFSNSKIGLAGLAHQEGRVRDRAELQLLDDHRSISLPWVSDLRPYQIVQLRKEAAKALPMFREMLARRLASSPDEHAAPSVKDTIDELRLQAVDVRNELANTQQHAARFWKTSYMLLGLGVSAYGVGTDQVVPALGGLLPLLQLIMNHKAGTEKDIDKLVRRPGYVLVKAQDILAHNHLAPARDT